MTVESQSVPTTNTVEFTATFLRNDSPQATLRSGEADTLSIRFDAIAIGNSEPLSIYKQETPGDITIPPGNLAFVDRSVNRKIALRYGKPGENQQNIIYALED